MSQIDMDTMDYERIAKSKKTRPFRLTRRELEVISLLHQGLTNKQIATELSVTPITVKHHLTHIFCKVDVVNQLQLVVLASEYGLVGNPGPSNQPRLQIQQSS